MLPLCICKLYFNKKLGIFPFLSTYAALQPFHIGRTKLLMEKESLIVCDHM